MAVTGCKSNSEIPRASICDLTWEGFEIQFFKQARPIIITDLTDDWPCRSWTIQSLMEKVGENEVIIRGKTNREDYRLGKSYTIRKDLFRNYCDDLLKANARARDSYLAVASFQQAFPQLQEDISLPEYVTNHGKLHLGPYMWVALKVNLGF